MSKHRLCRSFQRSMYLCVCVHGLPAQKPHPFSFSITINFDCHFFSDVVVGFYADYMNGIYRQTKCSTKNSCIFFTKYFRHTICSHLFQLVDILSSSSPPNVLNMSKPNSVMLKSAGCVQCVFFLLLSIPLSSTNNVTVQRSPEQEKEKKTES